jgi:hypothetical protein
MIPAAVILTVVHFLLAGYESYIRGFAHGGLVDILWQGSHWLPLARLFDAVRFEAAGLPQADGLTGALVASLLIALGLSVVAARRLSSTMTFTQGQ